MFKRLHVLTPESLPRASRKKLIYERPKEIVETIIDEHVVLKKLFYSLFSAYKCLRNDNTADVVDVIIVFGQTTSLEDSTCKTPLCIERYDTSTI